MIPRFQPIPRRADVSARAAWLALLGRFVDELLSNLPLVLMPTLRARLGLSLQQVGALPQILNVVAGVVEPVNGVLLDVWRRKWLLLFGAVAVTAAIVTMGAATGFGLLAVGFALYGIGSGPLAHSADILLLDAHPDAPDRIYARSTLIATIGALLTPLMIAAAVALALGYRVLFFAFGGVAALYALLVAITRFPDRAGNGGDSAESPPTTIRDNVLVVLRNPTILLWLLFLLLHEALEALLLFVPLWLTETVGLTQAQIGLYVALEMSVGLVSLALLDRWLARVPRTRLLQIANVGLLLLYPLWLLLPGVGVRFALAVPISFLTALHWPIAKAQALVADPQRAGTVTAIHSLFSFVPFPLLFGFLAQRVGLTALLLGSYVGGLTLLIGVTFLLAGRDRGGSADSRQPGRK